jgi:hypothetical protein
MGSFNIYTQCRKHYEHLPNIEMRSTLPSEQPQFGGAWTLQGVKSVLQGCWPMLTRMNPTVVSSLLDVLWVMDHSSCTLETVEREKPSSVAVLDTLKPVCLAPTTIPHSKALTSFVLPIHLLKGTHTQSMSLLSQIFKILL